MVTKEQALTCKQFKQTRIPLKQGTYFDNGRLITRYNLQSTTECNPITWRANGACKTCKIRPNEFKLPVKHGLYDYGYITHENAHLFEPA